MYRSNINLNKKMIPINLEDFIQCLIQTVTINGLQRRTSKKKLLISFMGVGEPLLNLKLIEEIFMKENTIKFIRFNPIDKLEISENEIKWIKTISQKVPNLRIKTYSPPGRQIGSSCGEFTKHYYHKEIETEEERKAFEKWKAKHQIIE